MAGIVIVGGGLAGGTTARHLRMGGYEGPITIVAGEPHYPYSRPPLSKEYMQGKVGPEKVYLKPEEWYDEQNIEVLTGVKAEEINVEDHVVQLDDGTNLEYEKLLLATGARPRQLDMEGVDLPGVFSLRTIDDSEALAKEFKDGDKKVVFIGSGWIGMEVAAAARKYGNEVTILERGDIPLSHALGDKLGLQFQQMHEANGAQFITEANTEKIVGTDRVEGVVVNGETIPADVVVVGVGAIPNTEVAQAAGLEVENGVKTDRFMQTSAPDIYAVGDVANIYNPTLDRHMRSDHWMNALAGGKTAAKLLAGEEVAYDPIPYFYTDQYDLGMELSGYPPLMGDARVEIRGDFDGKKYVAFWLDEDDHVVAGMNVNIWGVNKQVQRLIRSQKRVDIEQLLNTDVKITHVADSLENEA